METAIVKVNACNDKDFTWNFFLRAMQESTELNINVTDDHLDAAKENSDIDESARLLSKYHIYWIILDGSLFVLIVMGNILTILAVRLNRRLRQLTSNLFVLNLAISDLLVGLTLPYHLAFYLDDYLGQHETTCILRFVMINLACSASIYNLIVIAIDRYIAVVHPLKYARHINKTTALITILVGWSHAIAIATMPIYWNCFDSDSPCELETVLPRYYTVAILCPLYGLIWFIMFLLYWKIWKAASTHARRLKDTGYDNAGLDDCKSVRVVLLVLGSFSICWLPFLIVACTRVFNLNRTGTPTLYKALFSLAMANSGINPMIYAWKNTKFRKAFQKLLHLSGTDRNDFNSSLKDYLQKQNELSKRETG